MRSIKILTLFVVLAVFVNCKNSQNSTDGISTTVAFQEDKATFTLEQKTLIKDVILKSEDEIRALLPNLPDSIEVNVEIVDWDLDMVGGVTGRTDTNSPPSVAIQISHEFPGGVTKAIKTALKPTIFHEFHHLSRGWAIQDNVYGPGIPNATVNEGLAVVFSETYTHRATEADTPPKAEIAEQWMKEILTLPLNANYQHWMFEHPDGRLAIGYRTGNFLVRKAMENSGKTILELSNDKPTEILKLAGF